MGKAPAFQFFPKDWLSDAQLRMVSFQTKGIWMDLICYMWWENRSGEITGSKQDFCRMLGCVNGEFDQFLEEAQRHEFCHVCVTVDGKVTVRNRRMYRERKDKENHRLRQQKYREKKSSDEKVTPPSPIPSPSPTPKRTKIAYSDSFSRFWFIYPKRTGKKQAFKEWKKSFPPENFCDRIQRQIDHKAKMKAAGMFVPEWPDPERYIKHERWDDELEPISRGSPVVEEKCRNCGALYSQVHSLINGLCPTCYDKR